MRKLALALATLGLLSPTRARAEVDPAAAIGILQERCASCHGEPRMSGLDLRSLQGLLEGGSRGPSIVPGDARASGLYQAVCCDGELRMPLQGNPLSAAELGVIESWIDAGAKWPAGAASIRSEPWWSFQPVVRPAVPQHGVAWARSPIDRFIARGWEESGLAGVREADRRTWIRRATYDLHGLPPTPQEVEAFLTDESPAAFEAAVERLLESKRYGERWGRYWLDVVRYADSGGFETDIYFPDAWRYRDYVIGSFNDDKPFDRFILEQVAADEIWPDDLELRGSYEIPPEKRRNLEARIGTGMYTVGTVYHEAALNGHQLRYEWLVDAVDITGEAFLGLTVGCARCHDHKFDPLTQQEYHGLMAFFEGTEIRRIPVVHKMSELGHYSAYPRQLKVFEYQRALKDLESSARKRMTDRIAGRFPDDVVTAFRIPKAERTVQQQMQAAILERALTEAGLLENPGGYAAELPYTPEERSRRETLIRELGEAAAGARFALPTATVLGRAEVRYAVRMTDRGDWRPTGESVSPAFPSALGGTATAASADRRTALATWLADPSNPLPARVMANRTWQGHFGRGLVGTPNNFGRQGELPAHAELLDWLAAEFVESGWSVKHLHRLIMLSSVYRLSSRFDAANAAADPDNRMIWRMNRRRLDAESVRDAVLAVAGTLNLKAGGPPARPPLSPEERLGMWNQDHWPESLDPAEHRRRSVYVFAKRQFPYPMFKTFDAPDPAASCGRRAVTTVAPQALTLLNSDFVVEASRSLARRLESIDQPERKVDRAWKLAFARPASQTERAAGAAMLAEAGPEEFARMIFNLNEFVYID